MIYLFLMDIPFFSKNKATDNGQGDELDKIFKYLSSITEKNEVTEQYFDAYDKIKKDVQEKFDSRYIHLFLTWEDFIISQSAFSNNPLDVLDIRKTIRKNINVDKIDNKMRLLFLDEIEQSLLVYQIFIQYIVSYVIRNDGVARLESIANNTFNELFKYITVNQDGLVFDQFNEQVKKDDVPIATITATFKALYTILYNIIENSYGKKIAGGFFNRIYKTLQQIYNREIASIFLKILPEQVLGLDEWLSSLSKEELEKQIQEKTKELNDLNNSLEVKVKERTAELETAYEELKQLDQKKSEFISVAAHQLRTPLSGFKWTFDMLIRKDLGEINEQQMELLKKTYDVNENMIGIVNDMLNTDLIITGQTEFIFEEILISEIIDEIIFEVEKVAEDKKINIIRNEDKTIKLKIDIKKMRAVIQNLIDNSIKYNNNGGTIEIKSKNESGSYVFSVNDTGIGIPSNQQGQVFERFYRAENAIRTHANGSGLGLFIAKSIIEGHGGTISFKSTENKGSTFTFTLPPSCNISSK